MVPVGYSGKMLSPLNTKLIQLGKSKHLRDEFSKTPTYRSDIAQPHGINTKGSMMLNQEVLQHKLQNVQTSQRMVQIIEGDSMMQMEKGGNVSDFSAL